MNDDAPVTTSASVSMVYEWIYPIRNDFEMAVCEWIKKAPHHDKEELFFIDQQFRQAIRCIYLKSFPNRSFSFLENNLSTTEEKEKSVFRSAFDTLVVKEKDEIILDDNRRKENIILKTWHSIPSIICSVICKSYHDDDWYGSEVANVVDDCLMYYQEMKEEMDYYNKYRCIVDRQKTAVVVPPRLSALDVENGTYYGSTSLLFVPYYQNCHVLYWKYLLFCLKNASIDIVNRDRSIEWQCAWDLLHECMVNKYSPDFLGHLSKNVPELYECVVELRDHHGNNQQILNNLYPTKGSISDSYFHMRENSPNINALMAKKCRFPKPTIVPSFDHVFEQVQYCADKEVQKKQNEPTNWTKNRHFHYYFTEWIWEYKNASSLVHAIVNINTPTIDILGNDAWLTFFESYYMDHPFLSCQSNCWRSRSSWDWDGERVMMKETVKHCTRCLQTFLICRGLYNPRGKKETRRKECDFVCSCSDFEDWPHLQTVCIFHFLSHWKTHQIVDTFLVKDGDKEDDEDEDDEEDEKAVTITQQRKLVRHLSRYMCHIAVYMCPSETEIFKHSPWLRLLGLWCEWHTLDHVLHVLIIQEQNEKEIQKEMQKKQDEQTNANANTDAMTDHRISNPMGASRSDTVYPIPARIGASCSDAVLHDAVLVFSQILQRQLEVEIVQELIKHPPPKEFSQWSDVDDVVEWIVLMKRYPSWACCLSGCLTKRSSVVDF